MLSFLGNCYVADSLKVEVRLYDRLFTDANPDAGGKDFMALLNPSSLETIRAFVEPGMVNVEPDTRLRTPWLFCGGPCGFCEGCACV